MGFSNMSGATQSTSLAGSIESWTAHTENLSSQNNVTGSSGEFETSTLARTLYDVMGTIGILGNLVVILVIGSSSKLRTSFFNMLILNQSSIDLFVSVNLIALARMTSEVIHEGTRALVHCLLWQSRQFLWGPLISSTYNLIALTLERYIEVVHPIWHRIHITHRRVVILMISIWMFGLVLQIIPHLFTTVIKDGKCMSYAVWPSQKTKDAFSIIWFNIKMIIPLIILVYAYTRIAYSLTSRMKRRVGVQPQDQPDLHSQPQASQPSHLQVNPLDQSQPQAQPTEAQHHGSVVQSQASIQYKMLQARYNTIKTLFIVVICFFLCWITNQVYFFFMNMGVVKMEFSSDFYHTTVYLVHVNAFINPFIYCFQYKQFQKAMKKMFCPYVRRNIDGHDSIQSTANTSGGIRSVTLD